MTKNHVYEIGNGYSKSRIFKVGVIVVEHTWLEGETFLPKKKTVFTQLLQVGSRHPRNTTDSTVILVRGSRSEVNFCAADDWKIIRTNGYC